MENELNAALDALWMLIARLAMSQDPAGKWEIGPCTDWQGLEEAYGAGAARAACVLEKAARKFDHSLPGRAPDTELAVHTILACALNSRTPEGLPSPSLSLEMVCLAYLDLGYVSAKLSRPGELSKLGKVGARNRHKSMNDLKAFAIDQYKAGNWKSANQAAHALKEAVIKHGRTINAHLTDENAQRTIAEWFRKPV